MEDKHLNSLEGELFVAEAKAWDSLGRYKFMMFGYWAGVWVHLNRVGGFKRPNPWKDLVDIAKSMRIVHKDVAESRPWDIRQVRTRIENPKERPGVVPQIFPEK